MQHLTDGEGSVLAALIAVIAHSQISVPQVSVPQAATLARGLPDGYDAVDFAVLQWIAAETRHSRRHLSS
jgi:hypothetical protein